MTLARAIYKNMEIGKEYTTTEIGNLMIDADGYGFPCDGGIPTRIAEMTWEEAPDGLKGIHKVILSQMWKIVNTGYATTRMEEETLGSIRGCQFGGTKTVYKTYNMRYWKRVK